jgi:hypothetical protein
MPGDLEDAVSSTDPQIVAASRSRRSFARESTRAAPALLEKLPALTVPRRACGERRRGSR